MSTEVKTSKRNALLSYFEESFQELRKVTWPTRNQAVRLTFLVLGFCIAAAIVIGALDFVFSFGHQKLVDMAPAGAPISVDDVNVTPGVPEAPLVPVGSVTVKTGEGEVETVTATPAEASPPAEVAPAPATESVPEDTQQ